MFALELGSTKNLLNKIKKKKIIKSHFKIGKIIIQWGGNIYSPIYTHTPSALLHGIEFINGTSKQTKNLIKKYKYKMNFLNRTYPGLFTYDRIFITIQ